MPNGKPIIQIVPECTSYLDNMAQAPKAIHEEVEIKCFYEGKATLLVGTQTVQVQAGDVVIINPYEFHATVDRGTPEAPGKYHLVMVSLDYFAGTELEELDLRRLFFSRKQACRTAFFGATHLFEILSRVAQEYQNKDIAANGMIRGLMTEFFCLILREGMRTDDSHVLQDDALSAYSRIEPALRYIRDHFRQPVTVEELAEQCKISKHYFCRLFRSVTGKTAMTYLQEHRLRVADAVLSSTDKSIADVAEECGFESATYFCRCYKKQYSMAPSKRRGH